MKKKIKPKLEREQVLLDELYKIKQSLNYFREMYLIF
jgi:hypothetical protein